MFRSMKGHRPVAQLSSASCDTPHRQHSWASPPDSSSLTSKLLEQPCLPRTNDVSILRFHDYLCSVFTRDELYDRLSSTKPAHRADVHTLQLAAAYANIWVLVERLFQTIVRSRGIDFCTITATIHVVLSRLVSISKTQNAAFWMANLRNRMSSLTLWNKNLILSLRTTPSTRQTMTVSQVAAQDIHSQNSLTRPSVQRWGRW